MYDLHTYVPISCLLSFFFFNDTATTEIYTLSLHDALPILTRTLAPKRSSQGILLCRNIQDKAASESVPRLARSKDRKSTRLNSSHGYISYAVFCLKKKKIQTLQTYHCRHTHKI